EDFSKLSLSQEKELSIEEQAIESQYLSLINNLDGVKGQSTEENEILVKINELLKEKSYLLGNANNKIDEVVFNKLFDIVTKKYQGKSEEAVKIRHVLRWIDLIQNTLVIKKEDEKIKIDYSIELPQEIKVKEKKSDASKEGKDGKTGKTGKTDKEIAETKGGKKELSEEDKKKKVEAQKAKKAAKKAAKKSSGGGNEKKTVVIDPSLIDFRVGFIEKCEKHPNADSLYVSTIQMGDESGEPRKVCSGLVKHFSLEEMQQRRVVVVCNLKPVNMRGVKSMAMVLCGSDAADGLVEFVIPPENSAVGDKLFFEGFDGVPEKVLNPKKKIWETCQPSFSTTDLLVVVYKQDGKPDARLVNSAGSACAVSTVTNALVR
ncbi:nucleic acid-binding protein, partial [Ascoidea rubescens DSM 1968]